MIIVVVVVGRFCSRWETRYVCYVCVQVVGGYVACYVVM